MTGTMGAATQNKNTSPGFKTYFAFAAMCVVVLTESLDATSIAVVLPVIAESLKSSTTATFSLATSFLLASTIFQPVFASLSNVFGRKPVLLVALGLFLTGAIVGGSAAHVFVLLGGRIVQGIGAAGSISLTVVIVTDIVSLRNRAPWLGVLNSMWAVGSVSGPIIGGAFSAVNWRWIFWINIPLVIASFSSICVFLPFMIPEGSLQNKMSKVDYAGISIFLVSATSFMLPITIAGTIYPWSSWKILLPLLLGFVGLAAFVCHQKWIAKNPMIRLSVFRNRTCVIGHIGTFMDGVLLWMLLYYLPLYYEGVKGYSPLITGVAVFPETFTVAPANIIAAIAISKMGRYRWALVSGRVLTVLGMGMLCILNEDTPIVAWAFINLIPGIGLGVLMPATSIAIQSATRSEDASYAVSMYYLLRAVGQTVGVAVGQIVFQHQLKSVLSAGDVAPETTTEGLLKALRTLRNGGEKTEELVSAIVRALQMVWAVGCALAGVAGIASLWMHEYSLDKKDDIELESVVEQPQLKESV